MSYRVGLTGGIGSGKSTVAALFEEYGVTIIDSDAISRRLTQPGGAAIKMIRSTFGDDYIDSLGALDRPRMRQLVFADPMAKQRLEAILHPLIRAEMLNQAGMNSTPYQMLMVPLLFETPGYPELVKRTLAVDCEETTQVTRTMQRSGLTEQEVRAIIAQQIARSERLRRADDIIHNDADLNSLRLQVAQLHQRYLALSKGRD
ncbi:MAG: dephospho-CoA kinase [Pseudomonadota bacterium]